MYNILDITSLCHTYITNKILDVIFIKDKYLFKCLNTYMGEDLIFFLRYFCLMMEENSLN